MKYVNCFIIDLYLLLIMISITPNIEIEHLSYNRYGVIKIDEFEQVFVIPNDNNYYLTHDLEGNYDIKGSIFADYRTTINDKIFILYGHNSNTLNVPFKYLENYYDEDFYHKHPIIEIYNNDVYHKYQIYSVFIATNDFFYMDLNMDYQLYLKKIDDYSWYDNNIEVNEEDNIIILQTCSYHKEYNDYLNKYLIVVGKKIKK